MRAASGNDSRQCATAARPARAGRSAAGTPASQRHGQLAKAITNDAGWLAGIEIPDLDHHCSVRPEEVPRESNSR